MSSRPSTLSRYLYGLNERDGFMHVARLTSTRRICPIRLGSNRGDAMPPVGKALPDSILGQGSRFWRPSQKYPWPTSAMSYSPVARMRGNSAPPISSVGVVPA